MRSLVTMKQLKWLVSLALLTAVLGPVAQAQAPQPSGRGTPDDEKACKTDAVKLCRNVLGDDFAVLQCFQAQRQKLSPACRAVLEKYGQ